MTIERSPIAQCNELGTTVFFHSTAQDAAEHVLHLHVEPGAAQYGVRVYITYSPHNLAYPWEVHIEATGS